MWSEGSDGSQSQGSEERAEVAGKEGAGGVNNVMADAIETSQMTQSQNQTQIQNQNQSPQLEQTLTITSQGTQRPIEQAEDTEAVPAVPNTAVSSTATAPGVHNDTKVTVRFKPIGSTPSINPKIVKASGSSTVNVLIRFLCNKLQLQTVHLYVSNSFQPNPDESVGDLYRLFSTNNELVINYCNTIAFG